MWFIWEKLIETTFIVVIKSFSGSTILYIKISEQQSTFCPIPLKRCQKYNDYNTEEDILLDIMATSELADKLQIESEQFSFSEPWYAIFGHVLFRSLHCCVWFRFVLFCFLWIVIVKRIPERDQCIHNV